ncbi:MAG: DNA-directed RNA polymerase subunit beta' [bacterium]|nr:DNA-directed RNA polymerase subunit beta' [bacterium]
MINNFHAIKLKLASPEEIRRWSYGEVIKPETINYRTQRPEKDGLFSERIFGPIKDWECYCGKYKRVRYKGVVCDKCGVEVTRSIVRRERMAHIELASPVSHIWFLRSVPSRLSLALNVSPQKLEKVIYYSAFIIMHVDDEARKQALTEINRELVSRAKTTSNKKEATQLTTAAEKTREMLESIHIGRIISESEYHLLAKKFANVFKASSGANAVRTILENLDLKKECDRIDKEHVNVKEVIAKRKMLRRLKLFRSMIASNIRPEWMILTVLPVIPPDLRPMVPLDGGRYATSDLNDLYRRVINRNNRLKKLLELKAPEVIVVNEKRMLQEAVDALIDNSSRSGSQQLSAQKRPLRSIADYLKGKQGRFRQNLLGKRVDYSGRSVIVIGPNLKIDECGLPKKMALELFKPFVISRLIKDGFVYTIKNASRLIEQAPPEVWAILEEVISDKCVLLNRAPTLHRLSVQAFKPILIEGLAIQVPALVCAAFNADFDGDQMAVHVPLSKYAQKEAFELMLASKNILKPATGDPIARPDKDIVLGIYYLTIMNEGEPKKAFGSEVEILAALDNGVITVSDPIRIKDPKNTVGTIITTCGRMIFNNVLPADYKFVNEPQTKNTLTALVSDVINVYSIEEGRKLVDNLKDLGFEYSTQSGITWSMGEMIIPPKKFDLIKVAENEIDMIKSQFNEGLLTNSERKARVIDVWMKTGKAVGKLVPHELSKDNSIYMIIDSGSRGSWAQPGQMMGMRGLMANPKGEIIELPIRSSLKEGLSVLEYFISTHGARKGTTDTALKTAQAGYLTRRLVDVAQDLIIKEEDCKTKEGISIHREDGEAFGHSFSSRAFSRTALVDIKVSGKKVLVAAGEIIDHAAAVAIEGSSLPIIDVRSPITCKTSYGLCARCYGLDLGKNKPIKIGEGVGVVAAQSIGEPGTQLTMRTFHTGGVAGADITSGLPRVEELFELRTPKGKAALAEEDGFVEEIEERGMIKIIKVKETAGKKAKLNEYQVSRLAQVYVKLNDQVKKGDQLTEGHIDLQELYESKNQSAVERYILSEVQRIYVSEGVSINNKHIEVIIRQLFARVRITDSGDTDFIIGDIIEKSKFLEANREMKKTGKTLARSKQLLMGVSKVALSTESFLSAASFMETARVLVTAASEGRIDKLRGLKENVIIGRLIPAGTGLEVTEDDLFYEKSEMEESIEA